MRSRALSMIWPQVPALQRRQLIILLGQMATRHLAAASATEGQAYDDHRSALALGGPQDSGAASRSIRGGVRPPIHCPTDGAPSVGQWIDGRTPPRIDRDAAPESC